MTQTPFDIAVLFEKAIILNGIIANGTIQQKKLAKEQFSAIEPQLLALTNAPISHSSLSSVKEQPFF